MRPGWQQEFDVASKALKEAEAAYRFADEALARARATLSDAQGRFHVLYQERVNEVMKAS